MNMNEELREYARSKIKERLELLTDKQCELFRLMYGRKLINGHKAGRSVEDAKTVDIDVILHEMDDARLNHAMFQIDNTMRKNQRNAEKLASENEHA